MRRTAPLGLKCENKMQKYYEPGCCDTPRIWIDRIANIFIRCYCTSCEKYWCTTIRKETDTTHIPYFNEKPKTYVVI